MRSNRAWPTGLLALLLAVGVSIPAYAAHHEGEAKKAEEAVAAAASDEKPGEDPQRAALKAALQKLADTTKTLKVDQRSEEWLDDEYELSAGTMFWAGQDHIRIETEEGRGSGSVAVLNKDTVTGWMGGLLSFAKMSYDYNDKTVQSLRGNTMKSAGFIDDYKYIIKQWENVKSEFSGSDFVILTYVNPKGLVQYLKLKLSNPPVPVSLMTHEGEKMVGQVKFSNVEYNPKFEDFDDMFNP